MVKDGPKLNDIKVNFRQLNFAVENPDMIQVLTVYIKVTMFTILIIISKERFLICQVRSNYLDHVLIIH